MLQFFLALNHYSDLRKILCHTVLPQGSSIWLVTFWSFQHKIFKIINLLYTFVYEIRWILKLKGRRQQSSSIFCFHLGGSQRYLIFLLIYLFAALWWPGGIHIGGSQKDIGNISNIGDTSSNWIVNNIQSKYIFTNLLIMRQELGFGMDNWKY